MKHRLTLMGVYWTTCKQCSSNLQILLNPSDITLDEPFMIDCGFCGESNKFLISVDKHWNPQFATKWFKEFQKFSNKTELMNNYWVLHRLPNPQPDSSSL